MGGGSAGRKGEDEPGGPAGDRDRGASPGPDGDRTAEAARATMVDGLRAAGTLRSPAVAEAMATVPRHRFIDGATIEEAYANEAIVVKRDAAGAAISSASQPTIVAAMLEMSGLHSDRRPGQHPAQTPGRSVLEIGTGTGYNAALLATIVGADGPVVSVELDDDLAEAARGRLSGLGLDRVEVVTGDGAAGHPSHQPYDAVVVTAGAPRIEPAWVDQLAVGGRLVVPVVGDDGIGTISCLVKRADGLDEIATLPCGFLPLRPAT